MNEETVFHLARQKPPQERAAFLESACAGAADMRQRVEILLEADDSAGSFLQTPVNEHLATSAFRAEGDPDASSSTHCLDGATPQVKSEATVTETAPLRPEGLGFLAPGTRPGSIGRLGHYEILEVIGKGGFGTVLKAFDEKLHRVVAIKVLSPAYADNGSARKRFIREAHTAAAVKNEHVVAIYDVEKDSQPPYLAMEMIEGISLQDKIDKQGPLDIREMLRIGMQMAEGLAAAHKQGLVHRDIKPANILLENGVERVKITDFGLARAVDDASVTQSGTVAGTPMYMSPEQAEGLQVDHRSDLFSLGTVLYAMCTGHPPFRASGTHAVLKRVIDASPRPIGEINSEIPDWLSHIVSKLHAKKPEDRFQTAREVAELLGQYLAHLQQPGQAPMPMPLPQTPKSLRRKRALQRVIAALCLLLLATGLGVGLYNLLPGRDDGLSGRDVVAEADNLILTRDDPNVSVFVNLERGGQHGFIFDGLETSTSLPPGRYQVEGRKKNGELVFQKWVTLEANKRQTVHVTSEPVRDEPGWVQLFNGKDVTGWTTLFDPKVWRVNDSILVGGGAKGYLVSKGEYENFHFRVEAKVVGKMDSGQIFRFKPATPTSDQHAYEAQIGGDTGTLMRIDAAGHVMLFRNKDNSIPPDTWFTQEVIANGDRLTVKLNDETVATWVDDRYRKGHFALQCFSNQGTVYFRKIEIKELAPAVPVITDGRGKSWGRPVDPAGDCKLASDANGLAITVPPGYRDLNPGGNLNAPRAVQNAGGNFELQVKVEPFARPKPKTNAAGTDAVYASAGLVCWQDSQHFVRLVRAANGRPGNLPTYIGLEIHRPGKRYIAPARAIPDVAAFLRVSRREGYFQFSYSTDGVKWVEVQAPREKLLSDRLDLGVFAINTTTAPHVAHFRDIQLESYKDDKERLQGRWVAESVEMDGKPRPQEIVSRMTMTFTGNKVKVAPVVRPHTGEASFYLDEQTNPKKIDIIDEGRKGQFGIYRFDGDRFVLCGSAADDEKDRPTEFSSKGGKNRMLAIFKRAAAAEPSRGQFFDGKDLAATKGDLKEFQGDWRIVAVESEAFDNAGSSRTLKVSPEQMSKCTFAGDKCSIMLKMPAEYNPAGVVETQAGTVVFPAPKSGVSAVDSAKEPAAIDFAVTHGPDKGKIYRGLYRFVNDELWLCFPKNNYQDRPKAMSGGAGNTLTVLKRSASAPPLAGKAIDPVSEAGWVPLFNGRDTKGWVPQMEDPKDPFAMRAWEVLNKVLIARGNPTGYLRTEKPYQHFVLEMECQASQLNLPPGPVADDLLFQIPVPDPGIEKLSGMRLQWEPGGRSTFFAIGALAPRPPKVPPIFRPDFKAFKPDWNQLRFESTAGRFEIILNGKSILNVPDYQPQPGYFAIISKGTGMRYRNIRIKELPAGSPPAERGWVQNFQGTITGLAVSPNGKVVAAGVRALDVPMRDQDVLLLDLATGTDFRRLQGPKTGDGVFSLSFSPDGTRLAGSGGRVDNKAYIWNAENGVPLQTLIGHTRNITSIAFLPGGQHLLTTSWDHTLRVWDAKTGKELPLKGDRAPVTWPVAELLPRSGNQFFFGGGLGEVSSQAVVGGAGKLLLVEIIVALRPPDKSDPFWILRVVREFAWPGGRIMSLSVSPDGKRLLTDGEAGTDGRVRLWDVSTGKLIRAFDARRPPEHLWFDLCFLPDGKRFLTTGVSASGPAPNDLSLWDIDSGKVLRTFKGHTRDVIALAVAPDGLHALSGSEDKTVRMWDLPRPPSSKPGWVPLFNGKDLTGWRVVGSPKNSWQIRDQALWGGGAQTYLVTNQKLTNFQMRAEVRVNPGCELRILTRTDPTDKDMLARAFVPASIRLRRGPLSNGVSKLEVQLCRNWESEGSPEYTFTRTFKAGEWLSFDLTVQGAQLTANIDIGGVKHELVRMLDPAKPPAPGPIILYLGAKEGSVEFRKIEIKELPPVSPPTSDWVQLFNGKDLDGWKGRQDAWRMQNSSLIAAKIGAIDTERRINGNFHLRFQAKLKRGVATIRLHSPAHKRGWTVRLDAVGKTGKVDGTLSREAGGYGVCEGFAKPDEWFRMEIVAIDNNVEVLVNGKRGVMYIRDGGFAPPNGHIRLEMLSEPHDVAFRDIEIKELSGSKSWHRGKSS